MTNLDQCPSSKKEGKPIEKPRTAHALVGAGRGGSAAYFRGLDELAGTTTFREAVEREFPPSASELLAGEGESRRDFLKIMGAGFALAGVSTLAACRRPDHQIMPYAKSAPEHVIPGRPLFFATSMPLPGGGAEGLLIETHEGRPTKVEGNPLHPINQGKSSLWSQASILDLYDPDRLMTPMFVRGSGSDAGGAIEATWDDFDAWWGKHAATIPASGKGVAIFYDKASGPTRASLVARIRAKWPEAELVPVDALDGWNAIEGSRIAFGSPMREVPTIEKARVIVSIDRDFLQHEPTALRNARGWGASRAVYATKDGMSRLYVVEPSFSITGASADHRLALAPSLVPGFAVALARAVLTKRAGAGSKALADALAAMPAEAAGVDAKFVAAAAEDLLSDEARGTGLVLCGRSQPPAVHALVAAINAALMSAGTTVAYVPASADEAVSSLGRMAVVAEKMKKGEISTAIALNCNPVFTAPAEADFAAAWAKVPTRIALSVDWNETVAASSWRLNGCHYLEMWGDTEAADGTIAPIQPMIAPLYAGRSDIEVMAMLAAAPGEGKPDGYELVRAAWKAKLGEANFEKAWRRALFDGVLVGSAPAAKAAEVDFARVAGAIAKLPPVQAPSDSKLDVAFVVGANYDGRYANNAWLQELPEPCSHVCWDNPALISVRTAAKLGLMQTPETDEKPKGRVGQINVGGRTVRVAFWAVPGLPDNTVILHTGMGRREVGVVGRGTGFNPLPLRTEAAAWYASGATVAPVTDGDTLYKISCTQTHWSMEGRALIREVDLAAWQIHGDEAPPAELKVDAYGRPRNLNFAELLEGGEASHMPANVGIYNNPYNQSPAEPDPAARDAKGKAPKYTVSPQWGMSIDLAKCTGCNVCTVACQSENNIPVVGKIEVNKGREMQWIRVDRYFRTSPELAKGGGEDWAGPAQGGDVGMIFQPVACVQCENAPCETVCPVNATVHGEEGHNYMTYNRCIGTRYCANNCPYKVRRFNFFDYGVAKYQGGLKDGIAASLPSAVSENLPANHNLIPPRLRKKLEEISKMRMNPNVTVRSRGVMEKCTYCVQRTNEAKIDFKVNHPGLRPSDGMPDGIVQTACQQACPTNAITFGDILDTKSHEGKGSVVRQHREHARSYMLL
ncbi:MAG: TAT-variant-translocated molybdopterin oxidoreductase, partial [Phycisphaerae bacterium]|nr:TAT-variant-translocated molybdopterin oxidoreductase [Phycisphaerae bacterium]